MLIKELSTSTNLTIKDGGKRTIFLVKQVPLVDQQGDYISLHTNMRVGKYYGELNTDAWDKQKWNNEFNSHQVLVMTAQIFLDVIEHKFFLLSQVNLLILDECHHATGKDPYAILMNGYYDKCSPQPRILGLTASITSKKLKADKFREVMELLETILRARVESGSSREESRGYGTSAHIMKIRYAPYEQNTVQVAFEMLNTISSDIEQYCTQYQNKLDEQQLQLSELILSTDYRRSNMYNYNVQSAKYMELQQSQCITVPALKRHIDNIKHMGDDLGLIGLYLASVHLKKHLWSYLNDELKNNDESSKELITSVYEKIILLTDVLFNLIEINPTNYDLLYSNKVLKLLEHIVLQYAQTLSTCSYDSSSCSMRCIIFVERTCTAIILSQLLSTMCQKLYPEYNCIQPKHIAGTKSFGIELPMNAKYQRQLISDFRTGNINVLIATSVIEEGLDIPQCNLVFRFNKPNNFSSYMQSKQNASYVLFMSNDDNSTIKEEAEYQEYDKIEKMLKDGFHDRSSDFNNDVEEADTLPPYVTDKGIRIDATRAVRLIHEYCATLGGGQIFPIRILFNGIGPFTCVLTLPANCPIRKDVICTDKSKSLAKYRCCLAMVELLYEKGEFNEHCLPRRCKMEMNPSFEEQLFRLCDNLFDKRNESTPQIIDKNIAKLSIQNKSDNCWHLYRIIISTQMETVFSHVLGFAVPCKMPNLPRFNIYDTDNIYIVEVVYAEEINYNEYKNEFETFCRFLFEKVFNFDKQQLKYDADNSSYTMMPCLLTEWNTIDINRMATICQRAEKHVKHYTDLNEDDVYMYEPPLFQEEISQQSKKQKISYVLCTNECQNQQKTAFDKDNSGKRFIDYYEEKYKNLKLNHPEWPMACVQFFGRLTINFLFRDNDITSKKKRTTKHEAMYIPVELLTYGLLNKKDYQLFNKVPSIFTRITQLYHIEKLRKHICDKLNHYKLLDGQQMATVKFRDCLSNDNVDTNQNHTTTVQTFERKYLQLPLVDLTYDTLISTTNINDAEQLTSDILFQVCTRHSTGENTDMENLEILGDCFLKLAVSMSMYYKNPQENAGYLTVAKTKLISNATLYRCVIRKKLKCYLYAQKIVYRGKDANWLPPGYIVNDDNCNKMIDDDDKKNVYTLGSKCYTKQVTKRKAFADMLEAMIGATLITSGYGCAMKLMEWLGLNVFPKDENDSIAALPSIICCDHSEAIEQLIISFYEKNNFQNVEKILNYRFKNKAYLIAAFTHPSNFANRLTLCYERLEFLGDAVLDFLVTREIFMKNKTITPSTVTDIRQDLANNGRLAYIFVALDLSRYILHHSTTLFQQISSYAQLEHSETLHDRLDKDIAAYADATAPKALADVFEAIVGAIFLDSQNSLQTVWRVIEPFMRNYIEKSISSPNLNPVRYITEYGGNII
ncbi:unnamed protein product, partial [Didymodactylos carnosus]